MHHYYKICSSKTFLYFLIQKHNKVYSTLVTLCIFILFILLVIIFVSIVIFYGIPLPLPLIPAHKLYFTQVVL